MTYQKRHNIIKGFLKLRKLTKRNFFCIHQTVHKIFKSEFTWHFLVPPQQKYRLNRRKFGSSSCTTWSWTSRLASGCPHLLISSVTSSCSLRWSTKSGKSCINGSVAQAVVWSTKICQRYKTHLLVTFFKKRINFIFHVNANTGTHDFMNQYLGFEESI